MIATGQREELYNSSNMKEKRRHERLEIDLPVILRHAGRLIPATAVNVSCGGMFIQTLHNDLLRDHTVEVIFDLGQEQRDVSMRGQITRVEGEGEGPGGCGIGVQFTNLFSLSHKAIEQYLHKNLN